MKLVIRCALAGAILCGAYGCVQKSAKLQQGVAPPDKTLYESGIDHLEHGRYLQSRMAFQLLLNTYPDSDMARDAYFAMGDSYYEEGGTENLLMAEDQYNNFTVFYPGDPRAADAQMKIIALNYKMMRAPDRDQQYAVKTLQAIQAFEQRFSDSALLPIVRQYKTGVEDNLARGHLMRGKFYLGRGNFRGAQGRLREIFDNYKDFADMDEVLLHLGEISRPEVAADYYGKIVQEYPFSKYSGEAKARLAAMGREIPAVNTELADAHKALIKPSEGFNPLKPLVDFGKALGFIAPPDIYAEAKKAMKAEEEKALAAQAAAGDNIQIESEITKSASGSSAEVEPADTNDSTINEDGNTNGNNDAQTGSSRYRRRNNRNSGGTR